jgi:hypothetical protein
MGRHGDLSGKAAMRLRNDGACEHRRGRQKLAELIRVAARQAIAEGECAAADELISILELIDLDGAPTKLWTIGHHVH